MLQAAEDTRYCVEANPGRFFRDDFRELLEPALERLARLVGAPPKDLVLVGNASRDVNAVMRSFHLDDTPAILTLNVAYVMVKNTVQYLQREWGVGAVRVVMELPTMDDDAIVAAVERDLVADPSVRVASSSHIVSLPAVKGTAIHRADDHLVRGDGAYTLSGRLCLRGHQGLCR